MKKVKQYETPAVEVLEVKIEKGYAGSVTDPEPRGTEQLTQGEGYVFS